MSEWLKKSLEQAKNNFEALPDWARKSVKRKQRLLNKHYPFYRGKQNDKH